MSRAGLWKVPVQEHRLKRAIFIPAWIYERFKRTLAACVDPSTPARRSLIYGDRHPDKGLFHIDRSSMRNFVKGTEHRKC